MGLEALEFFERREIGVFVVEVDHKPDRDLVVGQMIEERAAAGVIGQGPAKAVLHQPFVVVLGRHLPDFLEAKTELGMIARGCEIEPGDGLFAERAPRAFSEQHIFAQHFHARRVIGAMAAVALDAHVAHDDAGDGAIGTNRQISRRKTAVNLDTQRLGLGGQPAADLAQRDDEIAGVVHQGRHQLHQPLGQGDGRFRTQQHELIARDRGAERGIGFLAPARQQGIDANRIDHRARDNMGADFRALLEHRDR